MSWAAESKLEYVRPEFTSAEFLAVIDNIRRLRNGGAVMTIVIEPESVERALVCWHSDTVVSINVSVWEPYPENGNGWTDG